MVLSNLPPYPFEYDLPYAFQTPLGWPNILREVNAALARRFAASARVDLFDLDYLVARRGIRAAYDVRMYQLTRNPFTLEAIEEFCRELARVIALRYLPPRKRVVLDCDNTLWGGILETTGPRG